jgi:hypothetical protein
MKIKNNVVEGVRKIKDSDSMATKIQLLLDNVLVIEDNIAAPIHQEIIDNNKKGMYKNKMEIKKRLAKIDNYWDALDDDYRELSYAIEKQETLRGGKMEISSIISELQAVSKNLSMKPNTLIKQINSDMGDFVLSVVGAKKKGKHILRFLEYITKNETSEELFGKAILKDAKELESKIHQLLKLDKDIVKATVKFSQHKKV